MCTIFEVTLERRFVSRQQEHFSLSKETKCKCDSPIVSHPKN